METYIAITNALTGLSMVAFGLYGLYKTVAEQSHPTRPNPVTRTVRVILGLLVIACGILAVLNGAGLFSIV